MGQEITLPEHIKVIIWDGYWTRQDAKDNSDKLFLFGGNLLQDLLQGDPSIPSVTQAVIRGCPNAFPVYTKLTNGKLNGAYFNDDLYFLFKELLTVSASLIEVSLAQKNRFSALILPSVENGIGTGTAYLKEKAPKCWELLQEFLAPLYERAEKSE
jgi:hypothetical protein